MNQQSYKMLCDDLEQIINELENQEPACNFSDDSGTMVEFEADFNEIWEGR